jgi:uncharacterized OB-fold protein
MTERRSIQPDVFELRDDGTGALIGGYSPTSGRHHFPLQDCCPYTGATDVERVELSTTGALWGWTAVTAAPPGYTGPVPYGFGVVELDREHLRVVTRLVEADPAALTFGMPMELVTDVVARDDDGNEVVTWAFGGVRA